MCSRVGLLFGRTLCKGMIGQECLNSLTANVKFCPRDRLTSCPGTGWRLLNSSTEKDLELRVDGKPEFTWMVMKAKASLACITKRTASRLKEEFITLCLKTWRFQLDIRGKKTFTIW